MNEPRFYEAAEFLEGAEGEPLGRLTVVWHATPAGGTEWRASAAGIAEEDARWCAAELRRLAARLEALGHWPQVAIDPPASRAPRRAAIDVVPDAKR